MQQPAFSYEKHTWGHSINPKGLDYPRLKLNHLRRALNKRQPSDVLEVGCGTGKFLFSLQREFPLALYTGVDISETAIEKARELNQASPINFLVADAEQMNFNENSFDFILILDVLEHMKNPQKVVNDCFRFLKPGGVVHTFIPCEAHSVYWLGEKILGFHTKEKTVGHIQRFSRKQAMRLVTTQMKLIDVRFSFHLLGSIMDYLLFSSLLNKKFNDCFWETNKFYAPTKRKGFFPCLFNVLLTICSSLAYIESLLLQKVAFLATGVHLTVVKKEQAKTMANIKL